jgi:hypothetical protein
VTAAVAKGRIKFEDADSDFLECSCGNYTMDDGFDLVTPRFKGDAVYRCNTCGATCMIDFNEKVVINEIAVVIPDGRAMFNDLQAHRIARDTAALYANAGLVYDVAAFKAIKEIALGEVSK